MPNELILLYGVLIAGAVLALAAFSGLVKPAPREWRDRPESVRPERLLSKDYSSIVYSQHPPGSPELVRATFRNPRYMWGTSEVRVNSSTKSVPFPVFRWWVLFENLNERLARELGREFFKAFGDEVAESRLYAISPFALDFLSGIKPELEKAGVSVHLPNRYYLPPPTPANQKIALFDIAVSTGTTVRAALKRLPENEPAPNVFLFIVLNDLVPPTRRSWPWLESGAQLRFLYKTSHLLKQYARDDREIIEALLTVQEALYQERSWDSLVEASLDKIQHQVLLKSRL